jgi:hypothetical protein
VAVVLARERSRQPEAAGPDPLAVGVEPLVLDPNGSTGTEADTGADAREDAAAARLAELAAAGTVLVLTRWQHEKPARRAVLESFADSTALVLLITSLHQVGARVLAYLLAEVSSEIGPARAAELFPVLEAALDDRVLVPTVARLEDPVPTVAQHLRSWIPGSAFEVSAGRTRGVRSAPGRVARGVSHAVMACHGRAAAALERPARTLAGPFLWREVPAWSEPSNAAAASWAEVVLWSAGEVDHIVAAARRRELAPCRWCGAQISFPRCVFCGSDSRSLIVVPTQEPAGT